MSDVIEAGPGGRASGLEVSRWPVWSRAAEPGVLLRYVRRDLVEAGPGSGESGPEVGR